MFTRDTDQRRIALVRLVIKTVKEFTVSYQRKKKSPKGERRLQQQRLTGEHTGQSPRGVKETGNVGQEEGKENVDVSRSQEAKVCALGILLLPWQQVSSVARQQVITSGKG